MCASPATDDRSRGMELDTFRARMCVGPPSRSRRPRRRRYGILAGSARRLAACGGTPSGVRPNPSLVRSVPDKFWATPSSDFAPVFSAPGIDPQSNFPRVGPRIRTRANTLQRFWPGMHEVAIPRKLGQPCGQWPRPKGNLGAWWWAARGAPAARGERWKSLDALGSIGSVSGGLGSPWAVLEGPWKVVGRRLETGGGRGKPWRSPWEALGKRVEALGMSRGGPLGCV